MKEYMFLFHGPRDPMSIFSATRRDNPPAWLFRVAKNKAIDVIRRQRRH